MASIRAGRDVPQHFPQLCLILEPETPGGGVSVSDIGATSQATARATPALLGGLAGDAEPCADLGPGVASGSQPADGSLDRGIDLAGQADALMEMAKSALAIAAIPFTLAVTLGHDSHIGATLSGGPAELTKGAALAAAAAVIALWIARIAHRRALAMRALIAYGLRASRPGQ